MQEQTHTLRPTEIYRMLIELANGNFAWRVPADFSNGRSYALAASLNGLAVAMQQYGYVNPYRQILQAEADDLAVAMVRNVQEHIQQHLEDPMPSARELAKLFGTNEFTLKDNFRRLLGTSLYRYYNDQRLGKAHLLIEHTTLPLKEVAFICGFNDYTNFFKAFRKKYGHTPNKVIRGTLHPDG